MINEQQEKALSELRDRIRPYMTEKRLSHTYAVEREICELCRIYAPDEEFTLRAAALLHDITKELPLLSQIKLCEDAGIPYTHEETYAKKIFHSRTAEAIIKRDFPEYAVAPILSAVRWHTTGRAEMTVGEILMFLADFIEDTRTFESCVELRRFFYDGLALASTVEAKEELLKDTMILAFDMTINELVGERKPIHADTIAARNSFLVKKGISAEYESAK